MNAITAFQGEYRFLSNMWPAKVVFENVEYPYVENAYQAAKTLNLPERVYFETCGSFQAKDKGKTLVVREDWEEVRYDIMYNLVRQKFQSGSNLREKLLATNDYELIEGNNWADKIWGCVKEGEEWVGQNLLGKILMDIRLPF